jgi:protein gp37
MAENSKIEWTDHTFNPWIGCTKVSPGCDHCYAEAFDKRFGGTRWGPKAARTRTGEANWRKPHQWNRAAKASGRRARVFCASLADVFDNHASILPEWRDDLWALIRATPHLDWLLLTKRPGNIYRYLPDGWGDGWPNVWLGTTVENQAEADRRIPYLLDVPAKVHFLSCEPLLGMVNFRWASWHPIGPNRTNHLDGLRRLDWIICGGESGPGARPMHPDWARTLRDQCAEAGVAFHFKQWGEWAPWDDDNWSLPAGCDDVIAHERAILRQGVEFLKVGKARAGRLLDGIEHNGFPPCPTA